ncbi:coproporphyrinogen III oxidase [Sphingorhabdus sp. IMCC26285]|uniref:Heme chaperone HemW n=1 Tax=Sphingorhabdus profundilacus TaxID=2509718 RepID=A0A6I4LWW9_9SPHN|nr:radical SAM family heme chaperone HemW [Sphingorhabdus profundilacus]MVZ97511.1 coproporphyrinogen III oxidase [Sphingorhabdus profundilacus]
MSEPLALYIHWPFCISKCPYCDFNSHVRESVDQDAWRTALLKDMAYEAGLTKGRSLTSIFFGGGTPSLMPPATVSALIDAAEAHWGFADDIEITLEANPSSVEAARFADVAKAGVNRVSLGLQSLDDGALAFLGRAHSVAESLDALSIAQQHFARVNIDLIYARPDQTADQWEAELRQALSFGTDHMSLYQLTIEPGTRFETMVRTGQFLPADNDEAATLYDRTQSLTAAAGLPAYEISNHSRQGSESRHNLSYWRYDDYIGIGPGAHGRRLNNATQRHKKPENFISAIKRNGHALASEEVLDPASRATEALLMGLRLAEGICLDRLSQKTGIAPESLLDTEAVDRIAKLGLIHRSESRVIVTTQGMPLLDAILPEIVAVEASAPA